MNKLLSNLGKVLTFVYIIYFGLLFPRLFNLIHSYNDETIVEIIEFLAMLIPGIIILILALNSSTSYNRRVLAIPLLVYSLGSIARYIFNIIKYESYSGIYYIILIVLLVTLYCMANKKELFYMLLCVGAIILIPDLLGIFAGRVTSLLEAVLLLTVFIGAYNDYKALATDNSPTDNDTSIDKASSANSEATSEAEENE